MEKKSNFFKLNLFFFSFFIICVAWSFIKIFVLSPKFTLYNLFFHEDVEKEDFMEFCLERAEKENRKKLSFFFTVFKNLTFKSKIYAFALAIFRGVRIQSYSLTFDFKENKIWKITDGGNILSLSGNKKNFNVKKFKKFFHKFISVNAIDLQKKIQLLKYFLHKNTFRYLNIKMIDADLSTLDDETLILIMDKVLNMEFTLHDGKNKKFSIAIPFFCKEKNLDRTDEKFEEKLKSETNMSYDEFYNEIFDMLYMYAPRIIFDAFTE